MALAVRVATARCSLLRPSLLCYGKSIQPAAYSASASKPNEDYFEKNKRLNRPLSPHLSIYKWQITMTMSISHRTTGLILTGALYGVGIGTLLLPNNFPYYINLLQAAHLSPALLGVAKFSLAYPLVFHFCSGLRHLAWDMGYGFEIGDFYKSGYAVVALSALLTTGLFLL
jgi:succinate dehydrogenase (ubiquinone) cytochrome b560 subunit